MQHPPMPEPVLAPGAFELSVPRNAQGERIGVGAIAEPLRPGLPGERLRGSILKAILRASHSMQAPRDIAEQERAQFAARAQEAQASTSVPRQPNAEATQLAQADRQQTEKALDATRSALKSEVAAQGEPAKPQPQDRNEGAKQPADKKEKKPQQETELIHFYSRRDGHELFALQLPRKYTTADVNKALKATGINYTYSPEWTPQPQDKSEASKKQAEHKTKEPETELVKFYSPKDGHELFTLQLPKGGKYTTADVNRALKAAGHDFTFSPSWAPSGWGIRGRDIWQALNKAFQASAPPPSQPPGQKEA